MILTVWIYHAPDRFESVGKGVVDDGSGGAFSQLFDQVGDQVAAVKDAISSSTTEEISNDEIVATSSGEVDTTEDTDEVSIEEGEKVYEFGVPKESKPVRIITTKSSTTEDHSPETDAF